MKISNLRRLNVAFTLGLTAFSIFTIIAISPASALNTEGQGEPILYQSTYADGERGTFSKQDTFDKNAQIVRVGIEPTSVYSIDIAKGIWSANFYIWWRWSGDLDPSESTDFTNNADASSAQKITFAYTNDSGVPTPMVLSNGDKYQQGFVRMSFIGDFKLGRFPLDSQSLSMKMESTAYGSEQMVYLWDKENLSSEKKIPVSGWKSKSIRTYELVHHYKTNFGDTDNQTGSPNYSQIVYTMEIERPQLYFYLKLLFPLVIILLALFSALIVRQLAAKTPLAIASTGLLTAIFSQQSYSQGLPPNAPAVLMDKIYLVGLISVLLVFMRVVLRARARTSAQNLSDTHNFMGRPSDLIFAATIFASFITATFLLITF